MLTVTGSLRPLNIVVSNESTITTWLSVQLSARVLRGLECRVRASFASKIGGLKRRMHAYVIEPLFLRDRGFLAVNIPCSVRTMSAEN